MKIYNSEGYTEFEGTMVEGLKENFGKLSHWITGKLIYKGEFKKDKIHGKDVRVYTKNGVLEYSGDMTHDVRTDGFGSLYHFNGKLKFKGKFWINFF